MPQRRLTVDARLKLEVAKRDAETKKEQARAAAPLAVITKGVGSTVGNIMSGIKGSINGAVEGTKAAADKVTGGISGTEEGTESPSPSLRKPSKEPKSPGLREGSGDVVFGHGVPSIEAVAKKSGGAIKEGIDGTVEGTKAAANKVGDVGKGALEATLKALGGAAAFQQVFASTIDKSDAGLTKAFEKVDADSSGCISANEMSAYIASVYGGYAVTTCPIVYSAASRCKLSSQPVTLLM